MNEVSQALARMIETSGLTRREIAERLSVHPSLISRWTNPAYQAHGLPTLRKLAAVLGHEVRVEFVPLEPRNTVQDGTLGEDTAHPQAEPAERTVEVELWLRVENNNKFVRGKTQSRREIEQQVFSRYGMRKRSPDGWEYVLTIQHESDEDLERIIEDILREAEMIADWRNGFIEADVREIGGRQRSW